MSNGGRKGHARRGHRVHPIAENLEGRTLLSQGITHLRSQAGSTILVQGDRVTSSKGLLGGRWLAVDRTAASRAANLHLGPGFDRERMLRGGLRVERGSRPGGGSLPAHFVRGPLVLVSSTAPLADSTVDNSAGQTGTVFLGSAVEPQLAVDPRNPNDLLAVWQQDRWSTFGARGIVAGLSTNGGRSWSRVTIPGITLASGGPYYRASDPWVTFSPSGGIAYASTLPFNDVPQGGQSAVAVSTLSYTDGRTWNSPVTLTALPDPTVQTDKESITADPVQPLYAYAAWNQQAIPPTLFGFTATTAFSRTTDGGRTWEPARVINAPGPNAVSSNHQLFARPDGTLLNVFTEFRVTLLPPAARSILSVLRSSDRGMTWSAPVTGPELLGLPVLDPDHPSIPVRTPSTPSGVPVQWADVTMDPSTGTLYAVWQDARFSRGPYDRIAFSRSTDGGVTWSQPIPINRTPNTLSPLNRQAFLPAVQVAADGTIGVSYYDFRNNTATGAGARTDAWIVFCRPGQDCTNPASWGDEVRLTDISFDLERAPRTTGGYFLGDYTGLETVGRDFLALFTVTRENGPATVVFRRVGPARS